MLLIKFNGMGKFKRPEESDIYWTILKEEGMKLKREHPVIIESNNSDLTSNVVGCSSTPHLELGDVKVNTSPRMNEDTYARVIDGLRLVDDYDLRKDYSNAKCNNFKDIKRKLKE